MNYNLEIQKILLKVEELPSFSDKVKALKEAIALADKHNDLDWGFDLRLTLIQKERNTSKCEESFPAFAWILNASDSNEDYFDESEFLWEYKWMFCSAYRNASISLGQIKEIGDDLRRRLKKNGYSDRAYYNVMTGYALHLRDYKLAQEYIRLADEEILDDMANCPACELDTKVETLLDLGHIDESLVKAQDLINKKLTCYSMPFQTFCSFANKLYDAGDDRASIYFDKALEEYHAHDQYDSSVGYSMGELVSYMAKTKHPEMWSFFSRICEWQLGAEDIHIYNFAKAMAPLMQGEGEVTLSLSPLLPYYQESGVYKLSDLYTYFKDTAYDYANRFDQRNHNTNFKQEVDKALN